MYPTNLKHKPILVADDYENKDGKYQNNTDCKALSIGRAQWDNDEISAKIWRYKEEKKDEYGNIIKKGKWSRQSEEMPLHRCLDLTILILSAFLKDKTDKKNTYLGEKKHNPDDYPFIEEYIRENPHLMQRIGELKRLLDKYDNV